ncbi:MAG: hypothetical protein QME90_07450 [Thermodesulfobacteriota bacterium]|nr:hypothetical protein [Thermodesulfobacteriota bacterium]
MNKRKLYSLFSLAAVLVMVNLFLVWAPTTAIARVGKPYYKGKAIVIVVSNTAGGGNDIFARLVSRYIGKFIPGNPGIVVRNMPGGGQLIGPNYVWTSKPDGLTWFIASATTIMSNMTRPKGTEFKLEEMPPIYGSSIGAVFFCRRGFIKEPKDIVTAKGLIWGHDAPTGGLSSAFIWAKELLGFQTAKTIFGYSGSGAARLAFLSGEVNFSAESIISYNTVMKSYVDKGEVVPVFQTGLLDAEGNIKREPAAPDVPTVPELYEQIHGKKPFGPVLEAYKLVVGGSRTYAKVIVLPKGTPAEILSVLNKAIAEMVKDPKYLNEYEKENSGSPHLLGATLVKGYPVGVSRHKEVVELIKKTYTERYGVVF